MKPTNAGSFLTPDSFAVDGTGQIIRPGNRVRIRVSLADPVDHGRVISVGRSSATLDIGEDEPVTYSLNRLALIDQGAPADPLWVYGTA